MFSNNVSVLPAGEIIDPDFEDPNRDLNGETPRLANQNDRVD